MIFIQTSSPATILPVKTLSQAMKKIELYHRDSDNPVDILDSRKRKMFTIQPPKRLSFQKDGIFLDMWVEKG